MEILIAYQYFNLFNNNVLFFTKPSIKGILPLCDSKTPFLQSNLQQKGFTLFETPKSFSSQATFSKRVSPSLRHQNPFPQATFSKRDPPSLRSQNPFLLKQPSAKGILPLCDSKILFPKQPSAKGMLPLCDPKILFPQATFSKRHAPQCGQQNGTPIGSRQILIPLRLIKMLLK